MDVTALQNNATMKNGIGVASLSVALDVEASTTAQLLAGLEQPPQAAGRGSVLDTYA